MDIELKQPCHPLVLIIVPNKDGIKHLSYSLDSIAKIEYSNFRVVVVDNCSNDNSVEYVQKTHPKFEIIQNKIDTGFAGSVNRGLLHGLEIGAEYIVIFSNDVIVAKSYPECSIIGFVELNDQFHKISLPMPHNIEANFLLQPDCVAIYILRPEAIKKVGLFDELYYMYGEDNDYFYRHTKAGYKTLQTNIPIWHRGEGFSDSIEKQKMITKYVYRNWLRFAVKNYNCVQIAFILAKMLAYALLPMSFVRNKFEHRSVKRLLRFSSGYRFECLIHSILWNVVNIHNTRRAKLNERKWTKKA
jgi:GT2 family glycosyltransferase